VRRFIAGVVVTLAMAFVLFGHILLGWWLIARK